MGKAKQQPIMQKHYVTPGGEPVKTALDATIEATTRHREEALSTSATSWRSALATAGSRAASRASMTRNPG